MRAQAAAAFTGLVNATVAINSTDDEGASQPGEVQDSGKTAEEEAASTNAVALGAQPNLLCCNGSALLFLQGGGSCRHW